VVSNVPGEADNGMDITSLDIDFIRPTVVDDNLAIDGTADTDIDYFASSTGNAIEINDNSIGLVSGASSRQIHGLFNSQSLVQAGDILETSISFVTPTTVAEAGEDIRIGLFDSLGRTGVDQLGQDTSFSTASPNLDFADLPGYYLELDIETADPATDLDIRRSDPSTTGRSLTTTTGFTALGSSPDIGYVIAPDTQYTVDISILRTEADELQITADFLGNSYTVDNGIDLVDVSIEYERYFNPEVIELPPIELPLGEHPDVEIIPVLPEGLYVPPMTTETVIEIKLVTKVIRIFGKTFKIKLYLPVLVEEVVEIELTETEQVAYYFGLEADVDPWDNFDLSEWALDTPNGDNGPITTEAGNIFGNGDTFSARTQDFHFVAGEQFPGSEPFFFTGSDGAMVFKSTLNGARTSESTSFARSELREMLRAGDRTFSTQGVGQNNWALDHQPENPNIGR